MQTRLRSLARKLLLNLLAATSSGLGLASTYLAYKAFGVGAQADLWMLGTVIVATLSLLAQVGVEQVAVFYARARHRSCAEGRVFARDSLLWSYLFGLLFALAFVASAPLLPSLFASGFPLEQRQLLATLLFTYWPLILVMPSQYVLRQLLLVHGKVITATMLGLMTPVVQAAVLAAFTIGGYIEPEAVAHRVAVVVSFLAAASTLLVADIVATRQRPHPHELASFIVSSASMRSTHSVHAFMVTFLSNHLLSFGTAGTVAAFQYARKIAEGLAAITVGPHAAVYHARQSTAWANRTQPAFVAHISDYLHSIGPLLALAAIALAAGIAYLHHSGGLPSQLDEAGLITAVAMLFVWQVVISLETIPVGVLALENRYKALLIINLLFIGSYYCWTLLLSRAMPAIAAIPLGGVIAQLQSVALFSWAARSLSIKHWSRPLTSA